MHKHWAILAYQDKLTDPNSPLQKGFIFNDGLIVRVDADSEDEAIEKAKKIITRNHYRINEVNACEQDHELTQDAQILQLKMMEKVLKKI